MRISIYEFIMVIMDNDQMIILWINKYKFVCERKWIETVDLCFRKEKLDIREQGMEKME